MANPEAYGDFDKMRPHVEAHHQGKAELERLYAQWEQAHERLNEAASASS